jgi:hypothetical protein
MLRVEPEAEDLQVKILSSEIAERHVIYADMYASLETVSDWGH